MSPATSPLQSRKLAFLAVAFIFVFFMLFTYTTFGASFTPDDGTAVVNDSQHFQIPMWKNILHVLTIFTTAYRPGGTLFWRPMYAMFGFNIVPYRVVEHFILILNIILAYVIVRRLNGTREAATLTALIFCYNAATADLYYDTCTVTDVLCLLFYALSVLLYLGSRRTGETLSLRRTLVVLFFFALALSCKEYAVAAPGALLVYELLFHRDVLRDKQKTRRVGTLLVLMFAIAGLFLKVKVARMGQNPAYHPHVTAKFVLTNYGDYIAQLFYLPLHAVGAGKACIILAALFAAAMLLRSTVAVFGMFFFVGTLFPVSVIPPRGAYVAYGAYFGLAIALGGILAAVRSRIANLIPSVKADRRLEARIEIGWFVVVAFLLFWAHTYMWPIRSGYFEWSKPPMTAFFDYFRNTIPEFPPGARVLIAEDPWGGDWGEMFLIEMMYHDPTLWIDRPKNYDKPLDANSYDMVVSYKPPDVALVPDHLFGHTFRWLIRGVAINSGSFTITSPAMHGPAPHVQFAPQAVRGRDCSTVTIPGLSNVPINVLYRIVTGKKSTKYLVKNWCTLDAKGTCTLTAPSVDSMSALVVDWIQPENQHWIFTGGVLTIVN